MLEFYKNCLLCPRRCGINRLGSEKTARSGFCGQTHQLRIAYVGPHFGEEPPITGKKGSGTVFFTGCSLRCAFCQNYQISHQGLGIATSVEKLFKDLENLILLHHVHNINFVTPDHFLPHIFRVVSLLRKTGFDLPLIYNFSGYQSVEMLKIAEDYSSIYLPDFKYSDSSLATKLSRCPDYPQIALQAIAEMVRQKGFLDACSTGSDLAKKGVLVRHLILPGKVENSINALTTLFVEFGPELPVSIMSQYHPALQQKDMDLNRVISEQEFDRVYSHAMDLGFKHLFVQFPDKESQCPPAIPSPFMPDFQKTEPFK